MRSARRLLLGALLALTALPATASAVTLVDSTGSPVGSYWQLWADNARVRTVGFDVRLVVSSVASESCGPASACFVPGPPIPTIWIVPADFRDVSTGAMDVAGERWALLHELYHVLDWYDLTDPQRASFEKLMGDVGFEWTEYGFPDVPKAGASDDFAEVGAFCAEHYPTDPSARAGWVPTGLTPTATPPENFAAICAAIDATRYSGTPGVNLADRAPADIPLASAVHRRR